MRLSRLFRFFNILSPLLALLFLSQSSPAYAETLNILYTGAIKGELEPCGCSPKTESGGLARLSGYLLANAPELKPYILVDAGNSLAEDTPQGRLKSEALLRSFNIIGHDAAAFLDRERGSQADLLIEKYPVKALTDNKNFTSSVTAKRGPLSANISVDAKGFKKGMLNILLTGKPVAEARAIKGWDVIVTSSGDILDEPVKSGNTIIVSGSQKGKKLGILTLKTDKRGRIASYSHRWQELGRDMKEDADVRKVLNEYDAKVAELFKEEEGKAKASGPYLGVASCAACHQPYIDSWKGTRHSGAFNSLESVGKSKDPECVKCHVTGYGEEGGFYSIGSTPGLANVQCETCHGPGREHAADFTVPMRIVNEQVCLRCHTKDNSPDFDFKSYFEKIRHSQGE